MKTYPDPYLAKVCSGCGDWKSYWQFPMRTERATPRSRCRDCDNLERKWRAERAKGIL